MAKRVRQDIPSLFDLCGDGNGQVESLPVAIRLGENADSVSQVVTSEEQVRNARTGKTTDDAASPQSSKVPPEPQRFSAQCIRQLNYGTVEDPGRCAVGVGECEVAFAYEDRSGTIWVYQNNKLQYTFQPTQHEKFYRHFVVS